MEELENKTLPESVKQITVGDKEIYLVGTAHVSQQSVEDVKTTVEIVKPDTICIELCQGRYDSIVKKDAWQKMDIFKIIKEKKTLSLFAQLILSSFYRKLGEQLKIQPGAEMLEGIHQAEQTNAELILADRDIKITLSRVWGYLKFFDKLKLLTNLMVGIFTSEKIDSEMIEKMKTQDQLEAVMEEFAGKFPEIKKRLIDERDIYLSQKIKEVKGQKVVAVIGAGHCEGITQNIDKDIDLTPLCQTPPPSILPKVIKWAIPIIIILLFAIGFFKEGMEHSVKNIYIWILVNGILSALGTAIALAHPVTILSAFLAAPLTSLNPLIAAGWVAGIVQAIINKPTVEDFERLPESVSSVKGFWTNPVTKILLVVILANLGSSLGTFISGGWIWTRTF